MTFPYQHKTHPRSRSLKIRLTPQGELIVTTPRFTPKFIINRFLKANQEWIDQNLQKIKASRKINNFISPDSVSIFGKKYQLATTANPSFPLGIILDDQHLHYHPPNPNDSHTSKTFTNKLKQFLKFTAGHYLIPKTHQLAEKMKVKIGKITLREQKTRWGSCTSRGNLNFNWRLVHFPPNVIDYVIIHELAHRLEMNHSSSFWKIVANYDPEYSKHRGWLKRQGVNVH